MPKKRGSIACFGNAFLYQIYHNDPGGGGGGMRIIVLVVEMMLCVFASTAIANDLYNSFTESIDQATSQAHITLSSGKYVTEAGDSKMVWNLDGGNRATVAFKYANRTLQSGSISFFEPLLVEIRAASGLCSIFEIKKLTFETGGALDPDNSDFVLRPPSSSNCNYSKNALLLEQHLAISNDSGRFFHGRAFVSSDKFKKCKDSKCTSTVPGQPISKVVFFSKLMPNGALEAIEVSLRRNATLRLPNNGGWIQVGDGTKAKVSQLTYDLSSESGSAFINEIAINVRSGSINTSENVLNLESGSRVAFNSIDIDQQPGFTYIKDGDISGALGGQSSLLLSSLGGKKSIAIFNKGEIDLKHVRLTYTKTIDSFKAQYATVKGDVKDARFFFSERNSLSLSSLIFQVDLKCETSSVECDGVEWLSDGKVKLVGTISPFEASINGGEWALDTANSLRVTSGSIKAPILKLDSGAAFFPVSGRFSKIDLLVDSQDYILAPGSTIALASVKLASNDLVLSPDEAYPFGALSLDGSIHSAVFGDLDRVGVANAAVSLKLSRKPSDSIKIEDGSIAASARVKSSSNDEASAYINLTSIRAYSNDLSADMSLGINSLETNVVTPGGSSSDSEGGDLGKVEVNVTVQQVPIRVALAAPLVFSGKMRIKDGAASVSPINDVPLALNVGIPSQELVYANVNGKIPGGSANLCNPKVNLGGGTYRIDGKADFAINSGSVSLSLKNFALQGNIAMNAEDRDCKYVAGLVCGAVGAIVGPGGAIAGAYLCASGLDKAEREASNNINEAIHSAVSSYKYTLGQ